MKFENTEVSGFKGALHGMRNPKNSWDKSDSYFGLINLDHYNVCANLATVKEWMKIKFPTLTQKSEEYSRTLFQIGQWLEDNGALEINENENVAEVADIGPADMKLAQTLIKSGPEHCKFLRQIFVSVDITAPLYW